MGRIGRLNNANLIYRQSYVNDHLTQVQRWQNCRADLAF
jgi:hypothetical protein